jgi:hypothetical protein
MDWDAKMSPWDLGTVVGPSNGGSGALDLKLGGPTSWKSAAAAATALLPPPSSSSAPAKRARSGQAQQAVPACSVEGCAADLSKCRDYHRRHKVCEAHSKTPVVVVAGQQQRFCQQCSRYALSSTHALFLDSFPCTPLFFFFFCFWSIIYKPWNCFNLARSVAAYHFFLIFLETLVLNCSVITGALPFI